KGRSALSSLTCPRLTPASPVSSAPVRPRIEGSPAMISIRGAAASSWPATLPTSSTGRNSSPVFSKNSPEPRGGTDSKRCVSPESFFNGAMRGGIAGPWGRQKQREDDDESGKPRTGSDNGDDNTGQHFVSF